jgi:hypothetical protein
LGPASKRQVTPAAAVRLGWITGRSMDSDEDLFPVSATQAYSGRVTMATYECFELVRQELAKDEVNIALPTGN